jgi:uncharacterized membrane protein YkvA (DUF1232 family)
MSLDIQISLSDSDLERFVAGMKQAESKADELDEKAIIASARELLSKTDSEELPDFIATRLGHLKTLIAMIEDVGFALPDEDKANVLSALTYFARPDDAVPDDVPVLGFLDDAIMIELCARDLKHEIEAYDEFTHWRIDEAKRRSEDLDTLHLTRHDWADAQRAEVIESMHRKRKESYVSGNWSPTLFRIH